VFRSVYFYLPCNSAIDVPDEVAGRECTGAADS